MLELRVFNMERDMMRKALKLITFSVFALVGSPVLTSITFVLNLIPFLGSIAWIAILIHFAHTVEDERKEYFSEFNIWLFTACAYLPGLAATAVFCLVMANVDAYYNVGLLFGFIALGSQVVFAFIGLIFSLCAYLSVSKESRLPKLPYCSDQINADDFFNDNKG